MSSACFLDDIHVDIVAVLLDSGVRLFDHHAGTPTVLGNPTVITGIGVTHLRYRAASGRASSRGHVQAYQATSIVSAISMTP